jgi:hypothetical protein
LKKVRHKECAYPRTVVSPRKKDQTVESFSIDVIGTLNNLEKTSTIAIQTIETYIYYGIVLLD